MPEPKIVSATIGPMPVNLLDPMPEVTATFDDGSVKVLFDYYPDEISFTPGDFVGLTEIEGRLLKGKRDRAYLQAPGPAGNARALHSSSALQAALRLARRGR